MRPPHAIAAGLAILLALAGCGLPHDPDGTTARVAGATLRVGVVHAPGWSDGPGLSGAELDAVRRFAASLDAEPAWTVAGESQLMQALARRELDLVVGAIPADTPWNAHVAVSRPYPATRYAAPGAEIAVAEHAWTLPAGENRFLVTVEAFLERDGASAP
ncbi:hypothetical protein [Coralloluteibacterium thermophilus]|uniref:ABC transporter substrate-binding protein n=1 Tax=Coralloluteibacterium thermophilum TaxID=2707049 RepID=A0ABV9NKI9_9GAMM